MIPTSQSFPSDADAVTFADGLPGFESSRRFVIMSSPALDPFMCLQGLGDGAPSFLTIDPRLIVKDYPCELGSSDRTRLEMRAGRTAGPDPRSEPGVRLLWLAIVSPDAAGASVNLRAPLVINPETMRGVQVLEGDDAYPLDYRLTDE